MAYVGDIREAKDSDMDFIYSSWLKSFRESHYAGVIPMNAYYKVYSPILKGLIFDRPGARILVATNPEEDDPRHELLGWIAREPGKLMNVLHYVYVKEAFRRHGVAKALFQAAGFDVRHQFIYTFKTPAAANLLRSVGQRLLAKYDPLVARYPQEETRDETSRSPVR